MNAIHTNKPQGGGAARLQSNLFWAWNIIFLAVIGLGFVPQVLPQLIQNVQLGTTPIAILIYAVILVLIPLASSLVGIFALRKSPSRLFALGYVLEWPLLLILMFRFFMIRQGNPAITVLLIWLAIAEVVFLWHLLDRRLDERRIGWVYLRLAGLSLLFAGTIYASAWLAFYVPPLVPFLYDAVVSTVTGVIEFFRQPTAVNLIEALRILPVSILGIILFVFSGSLIVVMPVTAPVIAGRAFLHSLRSALKSGQRWMAWAAGLAPLAITLVLLALGLRQPQAEAFALLEKSPSTQQQAQELLQQQDKIRSGLLNAYLAPYRYMSAVGEVRHVSDMYHYTLHMNQETAWKFEQAYEFVIRPLLYVPIHPIQPNSPDQRTFTTESNEAATKYQQFFDRSIVQGEQREIVAAVRSNFDGNQAEVAWQAVDDREVILTRQEVNSVEHGDWADVEIHEVYQNRTFMRKEVVYYFSLPESAVVTGLWLGPTADRGQAFVYQVAPRGAAQAVYRNEIRLNMDPALLEQIGPRQYRLRVFPVEPRRSNSPGNLPNVGPELHLWLMYRVMAQGNAWPLPQLADKFNVFWDDSSTRLMNGQPTTAGAAAWLPPSIPARLAVKPAAHRMDFPNGQSVIVRPIDASSALPSLAGLRLAVVLDCSFSMKDHSTDVKSALTSLQNIINLNDETDLYLTSSSYSGQSPERIRMAGFNPDQVVYFGGQDAANLLAQFQELQSGKAYDAILLLTDESGYALGQSDVKLDIPDAPVWIIHLDNGFPLGYDDSTLQAIQASGGGIAGSVDEALTRFNVTRSGSGSVDRIDGYEWQTMPTSQAGAQAGVAPAHLGQALVEEGGFAALAARRLILAEMFANKGSLDRLPILDQLHQLAIDNGIVTPYSSMLVLVDARQQNLLNQLEGQADRFQREVETIGDTISTNPNALTGVPEPHEWLLIALALLALGFTYRKKLFGKTAGEKSL